MRNEGMKLRTPLLLAGALLGCSVGCTESKPGIAVSIAGQFRRSNGALVDLAKANPGAWDRVCVLGPYSNNAAAKTTLGFDFDAEGRTAIQGNDGIVLLLFVRGDQVTDFVEHPRNLGDFAALSGQCFERKRARFSQGAPSPAGPAGMVPTPG
jgi:hypothetical protein